LEFHAAAILGRFEAEKKDIVMNGCNQSILLGFRSFLLSMKEDTNTKEDIAEKHH
jgi:hypothetical protein